MSDRTRISRCSARALLCAASLLVPAMVSAQTPWTVTLTPTMNPLPAGFCAAIHLTVFDATGKDVPRNPLGYRVTMADFDITVAGSGVAPYRIDSTHWNSCACQGAAVGSTATVTASYPAQALAANARVPGVAFQRQATFTIAPPKGTANPPACSAVSTPAAPPVGVALPPAFPPVAVAPAAPPVGVALPPAPPPVAVAPPARPVGVALPPSAPPVAVAPPAPPVGVALPPPPVAVAPSPAPATAPVALGVPPPAVPLNPSGFTAVQIAPGQVRLSWQAVRGASFYGLFGPGLTAGGEKIVGATTFTATNVPAGNQQWAVGGFIEPGNISTLASEFPRVSLNVTAPAPPPAAPPTTPPAPPVTSGRYRVVATRFAVGRETIDNVLNLDGTGDEIYGGFSMFHVKRVNGQILDQDLRRTKVHGQFIDGTDRVAGGSATPNGGFVTGDSYPNASSSAPGDQTFPFRVWDGTLTNGQDALVLLPSLWESDGDDENFDQWFLSEKNALPVFWWDADMRKALTVLGLNVVTTDTFATGFGFAGLLPLTSKDRPVGLTLQVSGFSLRRRAIVLTREILEAALTPAPPNAESQADELRKMMLEWNNRNLGLAGSFATTPDAEKIRASQQETLLEQPIKARPGESTIAVPLVDASTPNLRGSYTLYLRVERVP